MYNGSIKCDHSQGNYTKTQVSLACNYNCVCGSSYISLYNSKELVLIRIAAISNGYFGCPHNDLLVIEFYKSCNHNNVIK